MSLLYLLSEYCFVGFYNVLEKIQQAFLCHKSNELTENLTIDDELLTDLQTRNVISSEDAEILRVLPVDIQRNKHMLKIILRLQKSKIDIFGEILSEKKQLHVAKFFTIDPRTLGIHVKIIILIYIMAFILIS